MNAQEIFDTVVTHLLTQNEQSVGMDGECLYRGPGGLKCAVGALITDDEYSIDMEENSAATVILRFNLDRFSAHTDLLDELQSIHDLCSPSNWPERLYTFALIHGLNTEVIDKFQHKA
jgi:hypothetical protein